MRHIIPFVLTSIAFALPGCGDGGPALVKVTGTVTLNGKPYEGALVEFMPDRSNRDSTLGSDTTGPSGNYMVRSSAGRMGLAPGKYSVKISKGRAASASDSASDEPTPKNDPGQQLAEATALSGGKKKTADEGDGPTGTFPAEIPAGGINGLDFDVKSK